MWATAAVAERASVRDSEADTFQEGADAALVELKIILRALPEVPENGHPIDGETMLSIPEPMPLSETPL